MLTNFHLNPGLVTLSAAMPSQNQQDEAAPGAISIPCATGNLVMAPAMVPQATNPYLSAHNPLAKAPPGFAQSLMMAAPQSTTISAPTPPESRPRTTASHFWGPPPPFPWHRTPIGIPVQRQLWNGHPLGGMTHPMPPFLGAPGIQGLSAQPDFATMLNLEMNKRTLDPVVSDLRPVTSKRMREDVEEMGPLSPNTTAHTLAKKSPPEMDLPESKGHSDADEKDVGEKESAQRGGEGERRLTIDFESFGDVGKYPQTHGHLKKWYIPDGLIGKHFAYDEQWRFEVCHTATVASIRGEDGHWRSVSRAVSSSSEPEPPAQSENVAVCLHWRITNIKSGEVVEAVETPQQATVRMERGSTIASPLFREALRKRAKNLEMTLESEENPVKRANMESMIKVLNPKNFTQGPLMFGLKHHCVQQSLLAKSTKEE